MCRASGRGVSNSAIAMTNLRITNNQFKGNKPFQVWGKRWARYAGRCSGAARRSRTWERDNYICYYRMLGVSVNELAQELGVHRNTITNVFKRHADAFMNLWGMWQRIKVRFLPKYRLAHIVKNETARRFFREFNDHFTTRAWGWASHWKGKIFYERNAELCIETHAQ